jgi:hypothetical protein
MRNKLQAGMSVPFSLLSVPTFNECTYNININRLKVHSVHSVHPYFPRVEGFFSLFFSFPQIERENVYIRNVVFFGCTGCTSSIFAAVDSDWPKKGGTLKRLKGTLIRLLIAKKGIKYMWLLISVLRQVHRRSLDGGFVQDVVGR